MAYDIGAKIWHAGDEVTISSEPFEMFESMWQYGQTEYGSKVQVLTPEQREKNKNAAMSEWREQQAQFANLRRVSE